ncbi:hypothetical protein P7C73_g2321, partial [Tremellales sp. Uapishka_1]
MSIFRDRPLVDAAVTTIGLALVGSGTYGVLYPLKSAHGFGIVNAKLPETLFYPGLAGRNLSVGLAVLALTSMRDRKALGTVLLCWMCTGFADTYICLTEPDVVNTWIHVMNTGILAVTGSHLVGWW